MHSFGRHGLSVQGGITRIRGKIGIVDRERRVQIEYRDIRVHASRKVAFVGKSHPARGITADQRQDLFQSNVTLAGFRQQGGQECIKARKPWLRSPDAAVLGAARAVDVIGCDGVYLARVDPCPKRITVCRRTQGRIDLAHRADVAVGVLCQVLDAGFDRHVRTGGALLNGRRQRFTRRGVHAMHRRACDASEIGRARQCLGLDERRARGVPGGQSVALRFGLRHDAVTQHPGHLDVFRVRAEHTAILGQSFKQPEQKAVVGARQAQTFAFVATDVHEQFGSGRSLLAQHSNFGQLRLCGDDEMKPEINARARFGDGYYLFKNICIGFSTEDVRDQTGHTATRSSTGFGDCINWHARARNVGAVAQMDMRINRAGQNGQASHIDDVCGLSRARGRDFSDAAIRDHNVGIHHATLVQPNCAAPQYRVVHGCVSLRSIRGET